MTIDPALLFIVSIAYLFLLFIIAHAGDKGWIPESWISHPVTYSLSLGVYATSWSFYGSVGLADTQGFQFLTIYLGVTLAFMLSPVLLQPILKLCKDFQLNSLADVMAFRYRSRRAGIFVTLFMLIGTVPYIALQIKAVSESLAILTATESHQIIAFVFCMSLILFAVLFGAGHVTSRQKHRGLVAAIAFESVVKLLALIVVGLFILYQVFGGLQGLDSWLAINPEAIIALYQPINSSPWFTLIFLAFAASFLLPRQFHMIFSENLNEKSLVTASWLFPLFLLLLNLPIPIILWAGEYLELTINPEYFVLGVTLDQAPAWLSVLVYIGGLSAASAMVIVTSIALATMSTNHLLLGTQHLEPNFDLYGWLLLARRILIGGIIMAGYLFYVFLKHKEGLVQLGLISFVAVAQFIPGIIGLLYWHRGNRDGFLSGLAIGIIVWIVTLIIPLMYQSGLLITDFGIRQVMTDSGLNQWVFATLLSLSLNFLLFVIVSFLTPQREQEQHASRACCSKNLAPPMGLVVAKRPEDFTSALARILGPVIAKKEVDQALADVGLNYDEKRSSALRQLRSQIERNLSGLMGPQFAHMVTNEQLLLNTQTKTALADSMRFIEDKLDQSDTQLQGMNAELDALRRFHKKCYKAYP